MMRMACDAKELKTYTKSGVNFIPYELWGCKLL